MKSVCNNCGYNTDTAFSSFIIENGKIIIIECYCRKSITTNKYIKGCAYDNIKSKTMKKFVDEIIKNDNNEIKEMAKI